MSVLSRSSFALFGGLLVAAVAALPSVASAQVIDINGGTSWAGWNLAGNSQTSGIWVAGSTNRTYNIYRSEFVLSAGQTVGGTRLADGAAGNGTGYTGDTAASLFSASWQAGDRIIGMGIKYSGSSRGSSFWFHTDTGGNNIQAASSFGAGDGVSSFDAGDTASYIVNTSNVAGSRGRVHQYSIWNGFSPNGSPENGNYINPYGLTPSFAAPTRSFMVLDSGSAILSTSIQWFINIDAVLRSNGGLTYGDGDFSASTRFGFMEGDSNGLSQQIFAIPAPGAMALLGLAGLAGARRRR
jgi:hypothetical protein